MASRNQIIDIINGIIGLTLVGSFVFGLAYSISVGFAGFWGGLPFWVIAGTVFSLAVFDLWKSIRDQR